VNAEALRAILAEALYLTRRRDEKRAAAVVLLGQGRAKAAALAEAEAAEAEVMLLAMEREGIVSAALFLSSFLRQ